MNKELEAKMAELHATSQKEREVSDFITAKLADVPLLTERPSFDGASIVGIDIMTAADADNIRVTGPAIANLAGYIVAKGMRPIQVWRGVYDGRYAIDVAIAA